VRFYTHLKHDALHIYWSEKKTTFVEQDRIHSLCPMHMFCFRDNETNCSTNTCITAAVQTRHVESDIRICVTHELLLNKVK